MLDQFNLNDTLPRDVCTDFPARIERDMDLLLSLLGEFFADGILLSISPYLSDPTNTKLQSRTL